MSRLAVLGEFTMSSTQKFWTCVALFSATQLIILYATIQRENAYVAQLYQMQKYADIKSQLEREHNTLVMGLEKSHSLHEVKNYAKEILNLQQLPLSCFHELSQ
jgi:hypothetical protein